MKARAILLSASVVTAVLAMTGLALVDSARADPANEPATNAPTPNALPAPPDVAAPPASATRTTSGLAYLALRPGVGSRRPTPSDRVEIHYTGWTTDGVMFDSSVVRGNPATFPMSGVIPGFAEGISLMTEGGRSRVWIPENLAYLGRAGRPQGMLVFDIELIRIL